MASHKVGFPVFFLIWADHQRWDVPAFHIDVCEFLESFEETALLMMPRGHAKSTILAVYNAWRYYQDPSYRILHQGDQDDTAYKMSRDTQAVLENHPLTKGKTDKQSGEVQMWWVKGSKDPRNPSMQARGITSNVTSSRADEIQNDDVEVPRNIQTADAREKLRYRLGEQTHILVPGGRKLFVGTPHTHHSLYEDVRAQGAKCMVLKMFEQEARFESTECCITDFRPEYVFTGIGAHARLLEAGEHYSLTKNKDGAHVVMLFEKAELVDLYAGSLWPERFTRKEMAKRRKECRTLNEWDSQYQLHAKPINQVRIDPDRMIAYDMEPEIRVANGTATLWLGSVQIMSMAVRVDPSSGKLGSDVSAMAIVLQDGLGRRYWHRAIQLTGDVAEFAQDGRTIVGGQVWQICNMVEQYNIPSVTIETNGIGAFMPAVLQAAFNQKNISCGINPKPTSMSKNPKILAAFEPLLTSGMLWAHVSVFDSPAYDEMNEWNPSTNSNNDDYIDAAASAIMDTPERIQAIVFRKSNDPTTYDWGQNTVACDVTLDLGR